MWHLKRNCKQQWLACVLAALLLFLMVPSHYGPKHSFRYTWHQSLVHMNTVLCLGKNQNIVLESMWKFGLRNHMVWCTVYVKLLNCSKFLYHECGHTLVYSIFKKKNHAPLKITAYFPHIWLFLVMEVTIPKLNYIQFNVFLFKWMGINDKHITVPVL